MGDLLGFDFYGSGNTGDDLMLEGFLDNRGAADAPDLECVICNEVRAATLAKRFPTVRWTSTPGPPYERWIGVGDTPIQYTSGPWILNRLKQSLSRNNFAVAAMVGIGVEREAIPMAKDFGPLLRRLKCIGTRDEESADLLISHFGCSREQVVVGEDLAHIAPSIQAFRGGKPFSNRKYALGLTINGGDGLPGSSVAEFRRWLSRRDLESSVIVAAEVRPIRYGEVDLYRRWTQKSLCWWKPRITTAGLLVPDYWRATTVGPLIEHFCDIQYVLSSRYHGILTAAWLGCRVAAIARGSKVKALARDLDIPILGPHFRARDLDRVCADAHQVPPRKLDAFADRAIAAVKQVNHILGRRRTSSRAVI